MKHLFFLFIFHSHLLQAGADYTRPICSSLYSSIGVESKITLEAARVGAEKILNAKMSAKFPDLKIILQDPDSFVSTMEKRFEAQKKITPDNPYLFDYSEIALPLFRKMHQGIIDKISELQGNKKYSKAELETALNFLNDLEKDIAKKLATGKINYQDTVHLGFFYGNAIGHFDTRELSFINRNLLKIDRYIEGHRPRTIQEEYTAYKKDDFHLFQADVASGSSGYQAAEGPFTNAFNDKDKLQTLLVPNDDLLDCDIFMRLMSREKINIVGVTPKPIQADGFLRPSADFWIHDLRHESAKFHKKKIYLESNRIDPRDEMKLNDQLDHWYLELDNAVAKIQDPELKSAVELLTFNFYHDRGYPIAPSTFINADVKAVHFGLLVLLKASKVGVDFKNPVKNLKAAEKWLKDYWLAKLPEEKKFLTDMNAQ